MFKTNTAGKSVYMHVFDLGGVISSLPSTYEENEAGLSCLLLPPICS